MSPVDLANYIISTLRKETEQLDEETVEWVAYCTTCKAAVAAAYNDRRIVETAAITHARRRPAHQVIVGKEILGRAYAVSIEP